MGYKNKVKELILGVLKNGSSYKDIVRLVQITTSLSKSYLKHYYPSFLRLCSQHGLTEEDLAEDSILGIFARNDNGTFYYLQNFCDSLDSDIESTNTDEVFQAYRAFVQTVAIRQLVKTYANIDHDGAKLYRNIRDCIRKNEDINLTKDYRGFVIRPADDSRYDQRQSFPAKKLEKRFALKAPKSTTVPDMLSELMEILKNQNKYRRSVPLFRIVRIFKRHYAHISNHEFKQNYKIDLSGLAKSDHDKIKSEVLQAIQQKILSTYVVTEKINFREAKLLNQTLTDIINDWFDIKSERSTYFEHAKSNFRIEESQYKDRWRTKVEYLVRIAREQIESYILEGL